MKQLFRWTIGICPKNAILNLWFGSSIPKNIFFSAFWHKIMFNLFSRLGTICHQKNPKWHNLIKNIQRHFTPRIGSSSGGILRVPPKPTSRVFKIFEAKCKYLHSFQLHLCSEIYTSKLLRTAFSNPEWFIISFKGTSQDVFQPKKMFLNFQCLTMSIFRTVTWRSYK